MRAPTLLAVGSLAALTVACSKPAAEVTRDENIAAELELALFAATNDADAAVVSDLELGRTEGAEFRAPEAAPAPPIQTPEVIEAAPVAETVEPDLVEVATIAPAPDARDEIIESVAVADGNGSGDADRAGRGEPEVGRRGRGILIRGGVSGRDPCVIHLPGGGIIGDPMAGVGGIGDAVIGGALAGVGVMINDRTPRIDRGRAVPPSRGRLGGTSRGIPVFRGGIR